MSAAVALATDEGTCHHPPMGLFGKKKWEREELLESEPPLSAPPPVKEETLPVPEPAEPAPKIASKPAPAPASDDAFSVDDLVKLVRKLPNHSIDVVVTVLTETLSSAKVGVQGLVGKAEKREAELVAKVEDHKSKIASLEAELAAKKKAIEEEIATKKKEIAELESNCDEVRSVRERLQLGLSMEQKAPAQKVMPLPPGKSRPPAKKSATPPPPPSPSGDIEPEKIPPAKAAAPKAKKAP